MPLVSNSSITLQEMQNTRVCKGGFGRKGGGGEKGGTRGAEGGCAASVGGSAARVGRICEKRKEKGGMLREG